MRKRKIKEQETTEIHYDIFRLTLRSIFFLTVHIHGKTWLLSQIQEAITRKIICCLKPPSSTTLYSYPVKKKRTSSEVSAEM